MTRHPKKKPFPFPKKSAFYQILRVKNHYILTNLYEWQVCDYHILAKNGSLLF